MIGEPICEHGSQKRKCMECELSGELEALRAAVVRHAQEIDARALRLAGHSTRDRDDIDNDLYNVARSLDPKRWDHEVPGLLGMTAKAHEHGLPDDPRLDCDFKVGDRVIVKADPELFGEERAGFVANVDRSERASGLGPYRVSDVLDNPDVSLWSAWCHAHELTPVVTQEAKP